MSYSRSQAFSICDCKCSKCMTTRGYAIIGNRTLPTCWHTGECQFKLKKPAAVKIKKD